MAISRKLVVALMSFALVACGQGPEQEAEAATKEQPIEQTAAVTEEQEAKSEAQQTVKPERNPRITAEVKTEPVQELNASETLSVSRAAARILWHVNDARKAVAEKSNSAAAEEIDKGLLLAEIVKSTIPTVRISTTIEAGDLTYEDVDRVKPLVIPIHDELERVSVIGPLEANRREAAEKQGAAPSAVRESELRYTQVMLDVGTAEQHLQAAKKHLEQKNFEKADMALATIQKRVILNYVETDVPLVTASRNLMLADMRVRNGDTREARAALAAAADALNDYGKLAGENRAKSVSSVSSEIRSFAEKLDKEMDSAPDKIQTWWETVANWKS